MPSVFDNRALCPEAFRYVDDYKNSFILCSMVLSKRLYGNPILTECPWLSVVIPTYNRDTFLEEALESVLSQQQVDFPFEIVVVDNTPFDVHGQTPALRIIQQLGNNQILYYHNAENIGIGYNWNRCVELARGKWICFLHDDDLLCDGALCHIGEQIRCYSGRKPLGYIHARRKDFAYIFQADVKKKYPQERLTRLGLVISGCTGAGSPTCGTTILKKAYLETGGINYDYASSADAVLCYQIMKNYAVVTSTRILGGCRWEENESQKKETLLQMIQSDELLAAYAYSDSSFTKWWGGEVRRYEHMEKHISQAKDYGCI